SASRLTVPGIDSNELERFVSLEIGGETAVDEKPGGCVFVATGTASETIVLFGSSAPVGLDVVTWKGEECIAALSSFKNDVIESMRSPTSFSSACRTTASSSGGRSIPLDLKLGGGIVKC